MSMGWAGIAMSKAAHELGLKVVLTGEGADEHFGGYPDFVPDFCAGQDPSWPPSHLTETESRKRLENAYDGGFNISTSLDPSTTRILNNTYVASKIAKASLVPFAPWTDAYASTAPGTAFAETLKGRVRDAIATRWHTLHTSEYLWTKSFLPTFILRYVGNNVDMLYHVESRPPFLDHHPTEYVNGLLSSLKIKYQDPFTSPSPSTPNSSNNSTNDAFTEKHILRQAARPYITDEILHRKKKPFIGPARFQPNSPSIVSSANISRRRTWRIWALWTGDWSARCWIELLGRRIRRLGDVRC